MDTAMTVATILALSFLTAMHHTMAISAVWKDMAVVITENIT